MAIVHVDMIQGLSTKRVAVDFIAHNTRADGIISTKKYTGGAREGDGTLCDPENLCCGFDRTRYIEKQIEMFRPDAVEIMPGVMPKILKIMREYTDIPLIAGDCCLTKKM